MTTAVERSGKTLYRGKLERTKRQDSHKEARRATKSKAKSIRVGSDRIGHFSWLFVPLCGNSDGFARKANRSARSSGLMPLSSPSGMSDFGLSDRLSMSVAAIRRVSTAAV